MQMNENPETKQILQIKPSAVSAANWQNDQSYMNLTWYDIPYAPQCTLSCKLQQKCLQSSFLCGCMQIKTQVRVSGKEEEEKGQSYVVKDKTVPESNTLNKPEAGRVRHKSSSVCASTSWFLSPPSHNASTTYSYASLFPSLRVLESYKSPNPNTLKNTQRTHRIPNSSGAAAAAAATGWSFPFFQHCRQRIPSSATREKTKSRRSTCAYPSIIRLLLLHKWSDHSSRSPFFLLRFPSTSCCCCCCCYCYCQYIHLTVNFISFSIQSTTGTYEMLIFRDQSLGMAGITIMIMIIT